MTLGDIIEKILGLFGVKPGPQRKLEKRIAATRDKILEMEEDRNKLMRENTKIGEQIAELKRQLAVETNATNQKMIMDQVDELERDLERKEALAQQRGENITTQRAIRAKCEQLLEQLLHGADPVEIEMLMEEVEDMVEKRVGTIEKVDKLDGMGRKARSGKAAEKDAAEHAARMAKMLGTTGATPAPTPASAPKAPAPAAPAAASKPEAAATAAAPAAAAPAVAG